MRRYALQLTGIRSFWLVALALLLSSCAFPGLVSTDQQLPTVNEMPAPLDLPPIRFPQDEGAHRNLTEWWYYTGHLEAKTAQGRVQRYGFELVIFQALRSDLPPVYASHFAISDLGRSAFHYDQRRLIAPGMPAVDPNSTKGIDERIGDWSIQGVNGRDHLAASMQDYAIRLDLESQKPPVLHNGNGLITYGIGGFSYYYSRTHMSVSGTLIDHNQPLTVTGLAWMDHQWGDFLTLDGGGWDWYSIQLENKTELMLYFVRDASGKTLSTYAGYIDAEGKDHIIPERSLRASVLETWRSSKTGFSYPSGWRLEINDPQIQASLTLKPQLKDQELVVYESTGNTYWEGAVDVAGQVAGRPISGSGYVELTGYTRP